MSSILDPRVFDPRAFATKLNATREDRVCRGLVLGVMTETVPIFADRRRERADVFLGPDRELWGMEETTIAWSLFKGTEVTYYTNQEVHGNDTSALALRAKTEGKVGAVQNPYGSDWWVWCDTLEDMVRLWLLSKGAHAERLLSRQAELFEAGDDM